MTKLKKLLLTLAPISAVMIATPIILTSCSTNSETQNNGGGTGDGNGGTGGGAGDGNGGAGGGTGGGGNPGGGNGSDQQNPQNPELKSDATNSKDFKPSDKGMFNTIETTIKAGKPGEESKQIESAITAFKNPSETDVKDAINVWSFNKWSGVKNSKVQYTSNIENPIANQDKTSKKWNISFVYKFKIVSTYDTKKEDIYAERTFEAKDVDLAAKKGSVDFTTKASKFMVDGKDLLGGSSLYNAKADANETESVKKAKEFATAATSNLNIRTLATDYATNKNIKGEKVTPTPVWQGSEKDKAAVVSEDKKTMTVTLPNAWNGNIKKGATHAQIKDQLKVQSSKDFLLTYVKDGTGWTVAFDDGKLDAAAKTSTFKMTLSKKDEANVELTLIFKDVTS